MINFRPCRWRRRFPISVAAYLIGTGNFNEPLAYKDIPYEEFETKLDRLFEEVGMSQVNRIIRRAVLGKSDKYNILTFPTHERHDTELCKTGHNFYAFQIEGMKEWDTEYAPIPNNYYTLPINSIYQGINYDFILSQSKFGQFQAASQINQRLNIPIISMEVTVPIPSWPDEHLDSLRSMVGDVNVFLTEYSKNEWNIDEESVVIPHSLDVELFKPDDSIEKEPHVLSAVNDFINRDYCCNYSGGKE